MNFNERPKARVFSCHVCGRKDAPHNESVPVAVGFHYAPCGLPCEGGPISNEERTYHKGVHSKDCVCFSLQNQTLTGTAR
jgi:hypothetical protein